MATISWKTASNGDWDAGGNWVGGVPAINDDVLFNLAGAYIVNQNVDSAALNSLAFSLGDVTFNAASSASVLVNQNTSSTLTIASGSVSINNNVTLAGNVISITGGTLQLLQTTSTLRTNNGDKTVTLSGGTLDNTVAGQINIGTNTGADKTTTLAGGALNINGGTLKTGTIDMSAGSATISGGALNAATFSVSGGTFSQTGGSIDVSGLASFTSGVNLIKGGALTAGTLTIGSTVSVNGGAVVTVDTGTATISGLLGVAANAVFDATAGGINVSSGAILATSGASLKGDISGSGTITAGTGVVTATGSLLGTLSLRIGTAGTLDLTGATSAGSSAFTFTGTNGVLAFTSASALNLSNVSMSGMQVGTGAGSQTTAIDFAQDVTAATYDDNTNTLTVTVGGNTETFVTNELGAAFANWDETTDTVFLTDTVCYAAGTRILTERGEVAVEDLRPGDRVVTVDGAERPLAPVVWIGNRHIELTRHPHADRVTPVRIARDAFAPNVPARDLIVSPPHAVFLGDRLVPAKLLVNDMTITRASDLREVTYYHVELDRHAVILAEGLAAESYLDTGNRSFFANAPVTTLGAAVYHVDDAAAVWQRQACRPLLVAPQDVRPHWQALADRAVSLGHERQAAVTTTDPDLHLCVEGRRIDAIEVVGLVHRFMLPPTAADVRLMSRSATPSRLRGWVDDDRALGVAIRSITLLDRHGDDRVVPADSDLWGEGWHAPERQGTVLWRWTNGDAVLPVAAIPNARMVEVCVADTTTYPLSSADQMARAA